MPARHAPALLVLLLLASCTKDPPTVRVYVAPSPRAAKEDGSCSALAKERNGTWSEGLAVTLAAAGPLAIADASVLGGPFESPVRVNAPGGRLPVRVLLGATKLGKTRPLCVEVRLAPGAASKWDLVGAVTLDTDIVMIVDETRYLAATRAIPGEIFAGLEADASVMGDLATTLAAEGVPLETVLPTYHRVTRPIRPGDTAALASALRRRGAFGKVLEEPGVPAWHALRALADKPAATVALPGAADAAVAIESGSGDGAYVVAVGRDSKGEALVIEVRLAP